MGRVSGHLQLWRRHRVAFSCCEGGETFLATHRDRRDTYPGQGNRRIDNSCIEEMNPTHPCWFFFRRTNTASNHSSWFFPLGSYEAGVL